MAAVLRIRKQEGVSNRRTKTTKIEITDFCFVADFAKISA
jgi:hypothetical protein